MGFKVKRKSKLGGTFKVCMKSSFWSLNIIISFFFDPFNFLDFSFGPKLYFPHLLFSGLRERERERTDRERESLNSDGREKRSWLILIQTIRKVNVGVNEFHSMRRVSPKFYFSFSLPEIIGT